MSNMCVKVCKKGGERRRDGKNEVREEGGRGKGIQWDGKKESSL